MKNLPKFVKDLELEKSYVYQAYVINELGMGVGQMKWIRKQVMWSCPKFCSVRKNWKVDGIPPGWGIFGWESRGNGSTTKALAGLFLSEDGQGEHGSGVSPMDGYGLHPSVAFPLESAKH